MASRVLERLFGSLHSSDEADTEENKQTEQEQADAEAGDETEAEAATEKPSEDSPQQASPPAADHVSPSESQQPSRAAPSPAEEKSLSPPSFAWQQRKAEGKECRKPAVSDLKQPLATESAATEATPLLQRSSAQIEAGQPEPQVHITIDQPAPLPSPRSHQKAVRRSPRLSPQPAYGYPPRALTAPPPRVHAAGGLYPHRSLYPSFHPLTRMAQRRSLQVVHGGQAPGERSWIEALCHSREGEPPWPVGRHCGYQHIIAMFLLTFIIIALCVYFAQPQSSHAQMRQAASAPMQRKHGESDGERDSASYRTPREHDSSHVSVSRQLHAEPMASIQGALRTPRHESIARSWQIYGEYVKGRQVDLQPIASSQTRAKASPEQRRVLHDTDSIPSSGLTRFATGDFNSLSEEEHTKVSRGQVSNA